MIRTILQLLSKKNQRGGIAILTSLGFLLFSVPLITASLNLAQGSSIDARVKTEITHRQYCGLGTQEYLDYLLLDDTRWVNWLAANVDPEDPTGATHTETVDTCGRNITITVAQQTVLPPGSTAPDADTGGDSSSDPVGYIPALSAYGNRNFQTTKTVSDSNPSAGSTVIYTISVINRDDSPSTLTKIEDELPEGFTYDCNSTPNQLTLPGESAQDIEPGHDLCDDYDEDDDIDWHLPNGTSIPAGGTATLTFHANTSVLPGTYCNEVEVTPGGEKTTSGKTAIVQIGLLPGVCDDEAVSISKTVESATLVSTDTSLADYVYTFDIDFRITLENIGTDTLTIKEYIDLLPSGFSYVSTSPSGDITDIPANLHDEGSVDRQRVTWRFDPDIIVESEESVSLIFTTTASITKGNYWSDLLVDFAGGQFSEDRYSWPTALISVRDVYSITATDDEGNQQVIAAQVWIGDQTGSINSWTLP